MLKEIFKKYRPFLLFSALAFFILFPIWWHKGYLFLLDWGIRGSYVFDSVDIWQVSFLKLLLDYLAVIIGYGFFQKMTIFTLLTILGVGGYIFAKSILHDKNLSNHKKELLNYLVGVFMMINPFVYERLVYGQWLVVAGISGTLYFIIYLWKWYETYSVKNLFICGLIGAMTLSLSIHSIFYLLLISFIFLLVIVWDKNRNYFVFRLPIIFILLFLFNINIITGVVFGLSDTFKVMDNFNNTHLEVFQSVDSALSSTYTNVLSLHGFWAEKEDRFLSTQEQAYIWKPIFFSFFTIIIIGLWFEKKDKKMIFLIFLGLFSYILALGVNSVFSPFIDWLYNNIPFYIGLRDSQKWVGVLLISEIGLFVYGFAFLVERIKNKKSAFFLFLFAYIGIFLYTPTMIIGFGSQLKPVDFPQEWYEVRKKITCDKIDGRILFLPWHQYLDVDFLDGKIVVNPAKNFFGQCVIQGDNMEAGNIYTQKNTSESQLIQRAVVDNTDKSCEVLYPVTRQLHIKYLIISKSDDYLKYLWAGKCYEKIYNGNYLLVYQVK